MRTLCAWLFLVFLLPATADAQLDWRGMALGLWDADPHRSYARELAEIQALGANAVLFPVLTWVDTVDGTTVYRLHGKTAPDSVVQRAIEDAHAAGLRAGLMPIVRIENRQGREWRGVLSPADCDAFFRSYRNMIVHYAKLAEAAGAELFLMGSELASLEDAPQWGPIIDRLREVYTGTLSYSSNWDHYEHPWFWDRLDALALTGYYELADTRDPTPEQLLHGWMWVQAQLVRWQAQHPGKRIMFTEIGYHSQDGTAMAPWDYTLDQPIDLEEQRLCYEAFTTVWAGHPALAGVFFYDWHGPGGPEDKHYTPRGKPAEALVRAFFMDGKAAAE